MIRALAPMPPNPSMGQLRELTLQFLPGLLDMNEVAVEGVPHLAAYLRDDDPADLAAWRAAVAGWAPAHPTPEERAEQARTNADAIEAMLAQALTSLQATIDTPPASLSQCSQKIVQQARLLRRLVRVIAGELEGTD